MADHIAQGKAFFDECVASGNYHEDPAGFLYRFITEGQTGKGASNDSSAKPGPTDKVKVHYEGKLISNKIFDSSYKRGEPISFGLNQVIKGWGLTVQKMSYGDVVECVLPENLAYGSRGAGNDIPGGATLIFKIEYIQPVVSEYEKKCQAFYAEKKASGEYSEYNQNGVNFLYKYLSAEPAVDAERPTVSDEVTCHYTGTTIEGAKFDSSVDRGEPSSFGLNQVIKAWTISIPALMTRGTKIVGIFPAEICYGEQSPSPKIPANSHLIFEIELFDWRPAPPPQDCSIM